MMRPHDELVFEYSRYSINTRVSPSRSKGEIRHVTHSVGPLKKMGMEEKMYFFLWRFLTLEQKQGNSPKNNKKV